MDAFTRALTHWRAIECRLNERSSGISCRIVGAPIAPYIRDLSSTLGNHMKMHVEVAQFKMWPHMRISVRT